jgi:hypothetical protein
LIGSPQSARETIPSLAQTALIRDQFREILFLINFSGDDRHGLGEAAQVTITLPTNFFNNDDVTVKQPNELSTNNKICK